MHFEKSNKTNNIVTPMYVNCNCDNAKNSTKNFSTAHNHCSLKS